MERRESTERRRFQKPVKIPQDYNGSDSLRDFLRHFERCAVVNGWDGEERAVFLAAGLKGEAQKILNGLSNEECLQYDKIVERLELRFGVEKQLQLHQARLQSRRQQPKESLQSLATDIRSMVDLAYQDLPPHVQNRFAVQHFVDAISCQEDRFRLRVNKAKTLDDALSMARELEALRAIDYRRSLDDERVTKAPFKLRAMEEERKDEIKPVQQVQDAALKELCGKLENLQQQIVHQQENQRSLEALVKRLQLSQTSPPPQRRSYRRQPPATETTECWKCGRKGHYRRECPQNEQEKDSSSGNEKETSQKARGASD